MNAGEIMFERITQWQYHPYVLVAFSYILALFFVPIAGWTDLLVVFMVGTIIAIPLTPLLFFPYLFTITALALLLSLFPAIAKVFHRPSPTNRATPSR